MRVSLFPFDLHKLLHLFITSHLLIKFYSLQSSILACQWDNVEMEPRPNMCSLGSEFLRLALGIRGSAPPSSHPTYPSPFQLIPIIF